MAFIVKNEEFICSNCGKKVQKAEKTCRNHCPFCLYSLHLDNDPGDRSANCGGVLKPVSFETDKKRGYMIVSQCQTCGVIKRNKIVEDDSIEVLSSLNMNNIVL
ncbi:MAG: RNHCP domain-containing protein [Patescibacteria group bacterium]|nr:RNHCP domain-containing protein [Patescibacteria group bacterium]